MCIPFSDWHTYVCRVHGGLSGSAGGLSAAQRGDLRSQPCSTLLPKASAKQDSTCRGQRQNGISPPSSPPTPSPTHTHTLPRSRSFHHPLAPPSLDIKGLTLAFKQGQAKSSCQSRKLNTEVGGFGVVLETGGGVKRTGF